jgi:hypothetical protein
MPNFFVLLIALCCLGSLHAQNVTVQPSAPAAPKPAAATNLPPLPGSALMELFPQVTQVDFAFNQLPVTTTGSGNDAKSALTMISADSVEVQGCSPAFASMVFTGGDRMLFTGDVYFANGCTYFRISYQGKKYANLMTEGGLQYFNQIVRHVQESEKH